MLFLIKCKSYTTLNTHFKMNMDQLFKKLPRDLQWEVLSEFAGTHTVRKGQLRRKLVLGPKYQSVMRRATVFKTIDPFAHSYATAVSFVNLSYGRKISCYQGPKGEDPYYTFSRPHDLTRVYDYGTIIQTVRIIDHAVALAPFVKHSYPSYEHTDKKKKVRQISR